MLKVIEEFPNYSIDSKGNVVNSKGHVLKKQVNVDGYFVVNLYKGNGDKRSYHRRCARMAGLAHLRDSYFEGALINHKDFDRQNDCITNLEWVTPLENVVHSTEGNPTAHLKDSKYDEAFIRNVCQMIQDGVRNVDIIKSTGVSKNVLLHIRCGNGWTWVSKDYTMTPSRKGISETTAAWACHKIKQGLSYKQILSESECEQLTIHVLKAIKSKKTWLHVSKHILD